MQILDVRFLQFCPKKVSWSDGFEWHVIWRALKSSTALRDLQARAKIGQCHSYSKNWKLLCPSWWFWPAQALTPSHPSSPSNAFSRVFQLQALVQCHPSCILLGSKDLGMAGVGHCAPKSSIPMDHVLCRIPTPAAPRASDLLLLFSLCSVPGVSPHQQTRLWADKSLWEGGVYLDIKCFSLLVRGSCCFPLAGQSMPSLPGLRQFGVDCLQSAWLPLFSWVFWCMILENQRQDLSSWTPESEGGCGHCCSLTCIKWALWLIRVSPVVITPGFTARAWQQVLVFLLRRGFWLALEQIKAGLNQLEPCSLLLCSFLAVWMDMEHCSWHCLCAACWRSFKGKLSSPRRAFASAVFLVFYLSDFYCSAFLFCSSL